LRRNCRCAEPVHSTLRRSGQCPAGLLPVACRLVGLLFD
jgi:hypothetical protein